MITRRRWIGGAALAGAVAALAWVGVATAAGTAITWTMGADGVSGSTTIDGTGFQPVTLANMLDAEYEFTVFRVHDGTTVDDVEAGIREVNQAFDAPSLTKFLPLADVIGGSSVAGGAQQLVYLDFQPGTYVLQVNASETGENATMVTVTVNDGPAAEPPAADLELHYADFSYDFPDVIKAGPQVWHIQNVGSQPHFAVLFKLLPGKTADDAMAAIASGDDNTPPPFEPGGSLEALTAGQSYYLPVDLAPGNYVAMCFMPDLATGVPHAMEGMVDSFTVE
jgi:hypothetical protein